MLPACFRPVCAVEVSIGNSLLDVSAHDLSAAVEVGDSARHFEDAVVGARRHVEARHSVAEQFETFGIGLCILVEQFRGHLGIAMHIFDVLITLRLYLSGSDNALANGFARFGGYGRRHLVEFDGRHFDLQVDTVEKRSADAVNVSLDGAGSADALLCGVVIVAAWAGIHRRHEHKSCGIVDGIFSARDRDVTVFERLAHHFEHLSAEFGEFIEEENTVVGKADFAGHGIRAASDECDKLDI